MDPYTCTSLWFGQSKAECFKRVLNYMTVCDAVVERFKTMKHPS